MSEIVQAVYERGVLHPLDPLDLRERQRVRIQVWPEDVPEEEVLQVLVEAGLLRPQPRRISPPPPPLSEAERQALADEVGRAPGKSLSDIVIEERGEC
ncbi:MAG: antitoxin family protein [Anaerolineae bacterium]|nr:antitoxin family protein [Anaerolineae bacterium]